MVFGTIMPAFAEDAATTAADSQAGQDLMSYGVIAGTDKGLEEASVLTREQMTVILSQLYGMKAEAEAYAFAPSFTDVEEGKWSTPYIAFAEQKGWMSGDAAGGTFRPTDVMKAQEVNAMFVKALGYTVEWADVNTKAEELEIAVTAADSTSVLRGEGFAALRTVLDTPKMDATVTLGTDLELTNYVSPTPAAPAAVVITDAVALNSTVIEVTLDDDVDAPTALTLDQFVVTDEDDAVVEVEKAEFAPWDADNYVVLVTVEGLDAGSLYTVTSGDDAANFGGRAADETEPTVTDVDSTDYNEVTVTFSEAVLIDGLTLELTEKYGDKDELAVLDMEYSSSTEIVFTTDGQTDELYASVVAGAVDLAGNVMDEDDSETFVGKEMTTDDMTVVDADAEDFNQVVVNFDQKIDAADVASFTITEKYGDKAEIAVLAVEVITDIEDYDKATADDMAVLLTVEDLTESTLYVVAVEDMVSIYGNDLDADQETTFVGVAKPDDEVTVVSAEATSNTEVDVTFSAKLEESTVDASLFTITAKYGDKDEIAVTAAELDGKIVTLTVASMTDELYEIEVAEGIIDIYGNELDADNDTDTFVGAEVADEIASIDSITRPSTDADTTIVVEFDQNVGDNATDVALYTINNGVGYPEKVETDSDAPKTVILTIPETTEGTTYTLTVKDGLLNSDGVASEDDLTKTFAGKGETAGLPQLEAAIATDDHTLKLYFDRDVTDATIDGTIWDSAPTTPVMLGNIEVKSADDSTYTLNLSTLGAEYVYQDTAEETVLVIRYDAAKFATSDDYKTFDIKADTTLVDEDYNELEFATTSTELNGPMVEAVQGLNENTLHVYMDGPTDIDSINVSDFDILDDAGDAFVTTLAVVKIADSDTEFKLTSTTKFESAEYTLEVDDTPLFTDITGSISFTDDESDTQDFKFAGNASAADDDITNIDVIAKNARTLEVHFPEAMDDTEVHTALNYDAYTDLDTSYTFLDGTSPMYVTYDEDTNVATLYFAADLDVASADEYFVSFNKTALKDVTGKMFVIDDKDMVAIEYAVDADAAAEPTIESSTLDLSHAFATVKFDQAVAYTANGVAATINADGNVLVGEISNETVTSTHQSGVLATWFDVDGLDVNGDALAIKEVVRKDNDEVKVYFVVEPKFGAEFTIMTNNAATKDIVGIVGNVANEDNESDEELETIIAVPSSKTNAYDGVDPRIVSVTAASSNAVTTVAKEDDTVIFTFVFSEAVTVSGLTATTATTVGTAVTTDLDASKASTDTVVFTVAASEDGAVALATMAFTITDAAGNDVAYADLNAVTTEAGAVVGTVTADNTAVTSTVTAQNATTNDADSLVVTYAEALYASGTVVADGADIADQYTAAGGTLAITSATYDDTAKTVTFVLANALDTNTVTVKATLTDAAGNAIDAANDVHAYDNDAAEDVWVQQ